MRHATRPSTAAHARARRSGDDDALTRRGGADKRSHPPEPVKKQLAVRSESF